MSRAALREALRTLEIAGVIMLKKGVKGGAFVQSGDPANMTRVIQDLVHLGAISLGDLTEARLLIQSGVVRLACARATDADIEAIGRNIERTAEMSRLGHGEERRDAIAEFYRLLALATHNEILKILVDLADRHPGPFPARGIGGYRAARPDRPPPAIPQAPAGPRRRGRHAGNGDAPEQAPPPAGRESTSKGLTIRIWRQ